MARTYDTGLSAPQRTLIRAAIATRLAPLLKSNGGYLRKIGVLPRPMRGRSEEEVSLVVQAIDALAPAVLIALGRKRVEPTGTDGLEWRGELEVVVYAASSNARSYVDGRLAADVVAAADDTADPGIEVILQQIEERLLGQDLSIPTSVELREATEDETWTFSDITVWEQHYTMRVTLDINPNRGITQKVTSIEVEDLLDQADPVNPLVTTVTALEAP